jgi:hypothetical protein
MPINTTAEYFRIKLTISQNKTSCSVKPTDGVVLMAATINLNYTPAAI